MKISITEKQLENLISKSSEVNEEGGDGTPTSGESSIGDEKKGQPEVGTWESGVTRGPANQIDNTKWSDVVGSTLKRDKANKLK